MGLAGATTGEGGVGGGGNAGAGGGCDGDWKETRELCIYTSQIMRMERESDHSRNQRL